MLVRYVTEKPQPAEGHARILFINNSSLPFAEAGANPLGGMHKAEIIHSTEAQRRIANATMLVTEGEEFSKHQHVECVRTKEISKNIE